jgi:VWFA-related protein
MPEDEFFLVEFNDRPRFLTGFTRQTGEIEEALTYVRADGWTSLYDAIYVSINRLRNASNPRKALLVLSDGGDNNSRYNESEIRSLIREADVCIYTIGVLGAGLSKRNLRTLSDLAENTGGRLYTIEKPADLPDAIHKISSALRNQYILGYVPSNDADDGRYRKVDLRMLQPEGFPPLRVSWRMGYYAPDGH